MLATPASDRIRIDASHLERYCFVAEDQLLEDITAVLSAVRTADRSNIRQHSNGWARKLAVRPQVSDLRLWQSREVVRALNSIRSMQRLAELAGQPGSTRVEAEIAALKQGLNKPIRYVRDNMEAFLVQHQKEWELFLRSCGRKSWVVDFTGN